MKKTKKILIVFLLILIIMSQFAFIRFNNLVFAAETVIDTEYNRYFYKQLTKEQKEIYDAMYEMYVNGIFKTGKEEYNLSRSGHVTKEQLKNPNALLSAYGAARDAFQYDHPDVFYVDFSELSISISSDANGEKSAYLGIGRTNNYVLTGFETEAKVNEAINKYEKKLNEIVDNAKNIKVDKAENLQQEQVAYVHDYIVKNMIYHYEDEVTTRLCNARTAYDGLIYGEGVCEAYTRSFKAILDRLGIPCVCVYGIYRPNDKVNEPHIWNYVRINGKWYGVDVTHDDPTSNNWENKNSGFETRAYLLVGSMKLAGHHYPSGIMSGANYEFSYPNLELEDYRESYTVETDKDLVVKIIKDTFYDEHDGGAVKDGGVFHVSYKGKNYTQNAKEGNYIIVRYFTYAPGTDTWTVSDWSYIDPWTVSFGDKEINKQIEPEEKIPGLGYCVKLPIPQVKKAQFAVTNIAPAYTDLKEHPETWGQNNQKLFERMKDGAAYYKGNPAYLEIMTDEIENEWGDYVAPPYPTKLSPTATGALYVGQKYHMEWSFEDKLIPDKDDKTSIGIELINSQNMGDKGSSTGNKYAKIENFKFDGNKKVEFDFTPSSQFADDNTFYNFKVTGLVGEKSSRAPVPVTYGAMFPRSCFAYAAEGYDHNVFAQPRLIDTSDIDTSDWIAEDTETGVQEKIGERIKESLTHRLTLVTTEPTPSETEEMKDVLKNSEYADDFSRAIKGTTKTYNIKFAICKKQIIKTGDGVRVSVGFPAGTSYEDFAKEGKLEFKAYHYIVDKNTNLLTGEVEEIPVTVTPQGLIMLVDSFSPFTITAIATDDEHPVDIGKTLVITADDNGVIKNSNNVVLEGANSIIELKENDNIKLKVEPHTGKQINSICLGEKELLGTSKITDLENGEKQLELTYADLQKGSNVLNVSFIDEEARKSEIEHSTEVNIHDATIKVSNSKLKIGEEIKIAVTTNPSEEDLEEGQVLEPVTITYSSSDEKIATVSKDGVIKALKEGKATITVIVNGDITKTLEIEVYKESSNLSSPKDKEKEEQAEETENNKLLPQTGDIEIELFSVLMISSAIGIIWILSKKKNKKKKTN